MEEERCKEGRRMGRKMIKWRKGGREEGRKEGHGCEGRKAVCQSEVCTFLLPHFHGWAHFLILLWFRPAVDSSIRQSRHQLVRSASIMSYYNSLCAYTRSYLLGILYIIFVSGLTQPNGEKCVAAYWMNKSQSTAFGFTAVLFSLSSVCICFAHTCLWNMLDEWCRIRKQLLVMF